MDLGKPLGHRPDRVLRFLVVGIAAGEKMIAGVADRGENRLAAGRSADLSQIQAQARSTIRSSMPLIRIATASGARIASTQRSMAGDTVT
jgi:hypothetical protein